MRKQCEIKFGENNLVMNGYDEGSVWVSTPDVRNQKISLEELPRASRFLNHGGKWDGDMNEKDCKEIGEELFKYMDRAGKPRIKNTMTKKEKTFMKSFKQMVERYTWAGWADDVADALLRKYNIDLEDDDYLDRFNIHDLDKVYQMNYEPEMAADTIYNDYFVEKKEEEKEAIEEAYDGNDLGRFVRGYLQTALWTGMDEYGVPLDKTYNVDNHISDESLNKIYGEARVFLNRAEPYLNQYEEANNVYVDYGGVGHDFFLTRNGHGAGFWDGDWEPVGDELTAIAEEFGEVDVYHDGDETIYVEKAEKEGVKLFEKAQIIKLKKDQIIEGEIIPSGTEIKVIEEKKEDKSFSNLLKKQKMKEGKLTEKSVVDAIKAFAQSMSSAGASRFEIAEFLSYQIVEALDDGLVKTLKSLL